MARKLLNGLELADFIKNRQAKQVRMLRQAHGIVPKLVVIKSKNASPVINSYVRLKQAYAQDILIAMDVLTRDEAEMPATIAAANSDPDVHAIVIQLPLDDASKTDEIVQMVAPAKDVDGLADDSHFVSATAEAIDWLLAGYGVQLEGKKIVIVGQGRLVGAPLASMWRGRGLDVYTADRSTELIDELIHSGDVVVSAAGQPGLLNDDNIAKSTTVVDAGTASEDGKIVGDADPGLQARQDLIITPPRGGVGPLTIVLMFDHVIRAAMARIKKD